MNKSYKTQQRAGLEFNTFTWWNCHIEYKIRILTMIKAWKPNYKNKKKLVCKKTQIEILEVKNIVIEIKKLSNGLNNKLDTAEERISQL